jgi:hypothetical protein
VRVDYAAAHVGGTIAPGRAANLAGLAGLAAGQWHVPGCRTGRCCGATRCDQLVWQQRHDDGQGIADRSFAPISRLIHHPTGGIERRAAEGDN